uniref:Brain and acute leukemia cytoplasmic protein n=2 Tax=Cyprinus carpio TaxID=7962 RepID=A0A8C1KG42_CYPCA
MGCGGSRADAIEPRYHESWTRETESTWLTNTDAEIPNGVTSKNRVGFHLMLHLTQTSHEGKTTPFLSDTEDTL